MIKKIFTNEKCRYKEYKSANGRKYVISCSEYDYVVLCCFFYFAWITMFFFLFLNPLSSIYVKQLPFLMNMIIFILIRRHSSYPFLSLSSFSFLSLSLLASLPQNLLSLHLVFKSIK